MNRSIRNWLILFGIIAIVLIADQTTKRVVVDTMILGETNQPIPALSPFFQITRSHNTGAAFGILQGVGDIFLVIAVIVVAAMVYLYPRIPDGYWVRRIATGMICGGALGNALDRLEYGLVIDFIHYQIPGVISNVSNLADHAIVGGVILIFIDSWRVERQEQKAAQLNIHEGTADIELTPPER